MVSGSSWILVLVLMLVFVAGGGVERRVQERVGAGGRRARYRLE